MYYDVNFSKLFKPNRGSKVESACVYMGVPAAHL
jgi:hypothetical protein